MTISLDAQALRTQIEKLLLDYPELAEDEELRADMLEGSTDINWILGKLVDQEAEADANAEALSAMQTKLAVRRKRFEAKCEALRQMIADVLDRAGLDKWKLPQATLSVRKMAPKVVVDDVEQLPIWAVQFIRKPKMDKIKEWYDDDNELPGCHLTNGGSSLTIRRT